MGTATEGFSADLAAFFEEADGVVVGLVEGEGSAPELDLRFFALLVFLGGSAAGGSRRCSNPFFRCHTYFE
jgi:hypothetical protein